jgi:cyanophycinase-like exopeptidase
VTPHANVARGYVTDTEVLGYLRQHPGSIGIDIDQNTVLVLHSSAAEVFGDGGVSFIDAGRSPSAPWLMLRSGQTADLK